MRTPRTGWVTKTAGGWDVKAVRLWHANWQLFKAGKDLMNVTDKALGY